MERFASPFSFIDPGPLVDGELELVAPEQRWVNDLLIACRHPLTAALMPRESQLTRQDIGEFLDESPRGHFPGDLFLGRAPAYQFWMVVHPEQMPPAQRLPLSVVGGVSVRISRAATVEKFYGHIGYHVYPAARGHRYALRASQMVLPILRRHGFKQIWLTCDPDNHASRRTIELLRARYVETVEVPPSEPLYARGEVLKRRYQLDL